MVDVVQLVSASDCGSECRRFESGLPPNINPCKLSTYEGFYINIKKHYIETFYYVNGKRVSADTYFATGKNLEWKKYMYKACISYYKAHPDEFDAILGGHPKSHYSLV